MMKIYSTDDTNLAIAEWGIFGRVIANGNLYDMSYATFVTFRDGLIINYRESWNPIDFLAAMSDIRFEGDDSAN